MKNIAVLSRVGALCVAWLLLLVARPALFAQAATENSPAKSTNLEDMSQAELLKSYLQVRDQLIATQLAIANNRAEAEANARVQAAAIAEKLESIKSAMEAERQRQQVETLRLNAERERQQIESQRSNRTMLWVAVSFGALGLLAMLFMPLIQWRAINRMAEMNSGRALAPAPQALLAAESDSLPGATISLSNQRLMSVIERMEKRIFELEHTATPPPATPAAGTELPSPNGNGAQSVTNASPNHTTVTHGHGARETSAGAPAPSTVTLETPLRSTPLAEDATRVSVLLGKGKFLLSTNKAKDAVTCYDEVLKLEPQNAEALVKKGAALERLKQDEAAIRCYEQAIQVNRKMTLAYLSKAGICNRLGRYEEAMECYEQALEMEEAK